MKYDWLLNSVIFFLPPAIIYTALGYESGIIYILCLIAAELNRIGNIIRSK